MNEKIYDKKIFVESYYPKKETQDTVLKNFEKLKRFELRRNINKDMVYFDKQEWEIVLNLIKDEIKSVNSLDSLISMIEIYRNWTVNHYNIDVSNYVDIKRLIKDTGIEKEIFESELESIVTREQLYEILEKDIIYNLHDKVIALLLFEGVNGFEKEELRNLSINDCHGTSLTLTSNDGQTRTIKVPNYVANIINKSHNETHYHTSNGKADGRSAIRPVKETEYIIKFIGKKKPNDKILQNSLSTRISELGKWCKKSNFSAENISKSGMLDYLALIEAKKEEKITSNDIKKVYTRYNANINSNTTWSSKFMPLYEIYSDNFLSKEIMERRKNDIELDEVYYELSNMILPPTPVAGIDNEAILVSKNVLEVNVFNKIDYIQFIPEPNESLGILGEELALEYLSKKYPEYEPKLVTDTKKYGYLGYDIELKNGNIIEGVEVKATTTQNPYFIHITVNELMSALKAQDKYSLFIISFDGVIPKYAYRIIDILESLNIGKNAIESLLYKFEDSYITIYGQQFVFKIDNYRVKDFKLDDFLEIVKYNPKV